MTEPDEPEPAPRPRRIRKRTVLALLSGPLMLGLARLGAERPDLVEAVYVDRVFPLVQGLLRTAFSWWPVSAAETMLVVALGWLGWRTVRNARALLRKELGLGALALRTLGRGLVTSSVVVAAFLLVWGFTYVRQPYATHAGLSVQAPAEGELEALVVDLVDRCNELRPRVTDADLEVTLGSHAIDPRLVRGFDALADEVPAVGGGLPVVRVPFASNLLSRFLVSGVYFPYTGEAHVNGEAPLTKRPFTAAHEIAHQRGWAREDEANFVAWQVCQRAEDDAFAYSGAFQALAYALGALRRTDRAAYDAQVVRISEHVRADMRTNEAFWSRWRGPVSRVAQGTNDLYIRSSGQPAGLATYGRMLDLLLAERRARSGS